MNGGYSYPSLIDEEPVEVAADSGNETITIAILKPKFTRISELAARGAEARSAACSQLTMTMCTEPPVAVAPESAFHPAAPSEADQVLPPYETCAMPIDSACAAAQFA